MPRPIPRPSLLVSIDGGEAHAPTAEDERCSALPPPEVEVAQDLSALAVAAGTLPARTALDGAEHTMVWSIAPAPVESYALEQTEAGYTYRLVGDVEIATEAYAGALYASAAFLDFDNALETRPEGAALQASLLVGHRRRHGARAGRGGPRPAGHRVPAGGLVRLERRRA